MAFSSGTFSLVAGNPVVTGTTISSTVHNNTMSDIATNGLTNCLLKDGTQTVTANIPFGGFRLTGIGLATALTDAARADQVQSGLFTVLSSVSGTDTITATAPISLASYATGQRFMFTPANANTGAVTLNINSIGAKNLRWSNGDAGAGAIKANIPILVGYDGSAFHMIGNAAFIHSGFTSGKGVLISGSGTAQPASVTAASADDHFLVSTASASPGVAWKSFGSIFGSPSDGMFLEATATSSPGATWKFGARLVQHQYTAHTTVISTAATFPLDDSIPLSSEGTAVTSVAVTPKSTNNHYAVEAHAFAANDTAGASVILALFHDGTASVSALAVAVSTAAGANGIVQLSLRHTMDVGTLDNTTFSLRLGSNSGNTTLNGSGGGRFFGGAGKTTLAVLEIAPL